MVTHLQPAKVSAKQISGLRNGFLYDHVSKIKTELQKLGADFYDMHVPETKRVPLIMRAGEQLLGVVYGRYTHNGRGTVGRGVLVATNQRIFLLDTKPFFVGLDEFTYDAIGSVQYDRAFIAGTVTLHVAGENIKVRTFNDRAAKNFVAAVESQLASDLTRHPWL